MWYITTTFRKLVVHFFLLAFVIFSQYEKMEVFFTVKIKTTYFIIYRLTIICIHYSLVFILQDVSAICAIICSSSAFLPSLFSHYRLAAL